MKESIPCERMKGISVQHLCPTISESKDELAKSTYNISIRFWILFRKKLRMLIKTYLKEFQDMNLFLDGETCNGLHSKTVV